MTEYLASVKHRWPKAEIYGSGRWAVPSCGRGKEVSLRTTKDLAEAIKALLDRGGCGNGCRGAHDIIDLASGR